MYVPNKLIYKGLAISSCFALIAACQDRGQFRAKTYTAADIATYCTTHSANDAQPDSLNCPTPRSTTPPVPTPVPDSGAADDTDKKVTDTPVKKLTPNTTVAATAEAQSKDGAKTQLLTESALDLNTFLKDNNSLLAKVEPALGDIVKGISVPVTANSTGLIFSIDAVLRINQEAVYVNVGATALTVVKDVPQLKLSFDNDRAEKPDLSKQIRAWIACADDKCVQIQLRIQIGGVEGSDKPVNAVFVLGPKENEAYKILATNVMADAAKLASYNDARMVSDSKTDGKDDVKQPAPPAGLPVTVQGGSDASGTPSAPDATSAPAAEMPAIQPVAHLDSTNQVAEMIGASEHKAEKVNVQVPDDNWGKEAQAVAHLDGTKETLAKVASMEHGTVVVAPAPSKSKFREALRASHIAAKKKAAAAAAVKAAAATATSFDE